MIRNVADLLEVLKKKELEGLKKFDMLKHGPMIGNMYEGLTKSLLEKSIFIGLDLKVVSGKIFNSTTNALSKQIDCMLVVGEGENIPYTQDYLYDSKQIIAVIEVKKNLYSDQMADAYENLYSVKNVMELKDIRLSLIQDSYRGIVREELPERKELEDLPYEIQMIYHSLVVDAFLPVRIVLGYNGFVSEYNLRKSFVQYLSQNNDMKIDSSIKGVGPTSLPNLIICKDYSLVKLNGMPWGQPLNNNDTWTMLASTSVSPVLLIIELIWTRLSYFYDLPSSIFGDDLQIERMSPLLACKAVNCEKFKGWAYNYYDFSSEDLKISPSFEEWEPVFLNEVQYIILNELCINEEIDVTEAGFKEYVESRDDELTAFLDRLKETGLVYVKNDKLKLLTDDCKLVTLPDGRFIAGEDKSGRLTRWIIKYTEKRRETVKRRTNPM